MNWDSTFNLKLALSAPMVPELILGLGILGHLSIPTSYKGFIFSRNKQCVCVHVRMSTRMHTHTHLFIVYKRPLAVISR